MGEREVCFNTHKREKGRETDSSPHSRLRNAPPSLSDSIPFQLQINYIRGDGAECLRVVSCRQ